MTDNQAEINRKVLVCMDSGVGGLAVLKRLIHHLPQNPYIFLGDTAWMPYGEKPLSVVKDRVLQVHQWLEQSYDIGAFVLACNTATVAAYDTLTAENLLYPVLEPVKTTSEWVNANMPKSMKIGIMATPGTVNGNRYPRFLDPSFQVYQTACKGLASIIESGVCDGPALEEILLEYVKLLQDWGADTVILGCTHYSLIRDKVEQIMGPQVNIVDSAEILAKVAIPVINNMGFIGVPLSSMMVTGSAERFGKAINKLPLEEFQFKDITEISIGTENHCLTK